MRLAWFSLVWIILALPVSPVQAQVRDSLMVPADSVFSPPDSTQGRQSPRRSIGAPGDTLRAGADGVAGASSPDSRLKDPVRFTAADSLVIVFDEEAGDTGTLYGNAKVVYDDATLSAGQVEILFAKDELQATGVPSDTGMVGRPEFVQGEETFEGDALAFNLRTERGRVVGARTKFEEGFIRGGVVKVREDSTVFVQGGTYSTCECIEDPSYSLRADRMKVVNKKWVYTGPIRLFLFNIPTPLWLPFGFLPATEGRRSGPLPPTYGEDERGFYLRDWGWYWAVNDYMDAQLQLGFWTRGSWQVVPRFRYAKRYAYSGDLSVDYIRNRQGERGDPDLQVVNTSSVRWTHNQTLSPTARFSGNVNLASSSYLRTASESYDDRVRQQIESAVRYSKQWTRSQRSLNVSASQRQVLATGETNLLLPSLAFSQGARKPFERSSRVGPERWYERIQYTYNGTFSNRVNYRPLRNAPDSATAALARETGWFEALRSPSLFRQVTGGQEPFDYSARHTVPLSATFNVNRIPVINRNLRLNFSTNVNYTEEWFGKTYRLSYDSTSKRVNRENVPGFFAYRQFTSSASATTTIYGLFAFRVGPMDGFRHTIRPSLGLSFTPDFSGDFWGYTRAYEGPNGLVNYNVATGQTISAFSRQQSNLTFNVDNVFETKLAQRDTTEGNRSRTLKLLDVDFSGAYNFAADSLNLSDLNFSARSDLFDRLSLSLRATLSPYLADSEGRLLNRSAFSLRDLRLARFERMDFSARTSFRGGGGRSGPRPSSTPVRTTGIGLDERGGFGADEFGADPFGTGRAGTPDFALPWSLDLDLTYSLSGATRSSFPTQRHVATMNTRFDFSLTPKWKVQGQSGFDLVRRKVVTTSLNLHRDFECWQMSFSWVPFGRYQSYSFDLHVKAGALRDLLRIRQPRSDVRGRFDL